MIQKAELINEFSQRAAENKAAYFIGAGISIPYGLPDFENLIRELAKGRIDLKIKPNHNFPEIAQYILNASSHDKSPILKQIQCRFNIPYNKNKSTYLDSIAKSNVSTIWTTNFDTLIEQSLEYSGKKYISKNTDFDFKKEFETPIVKNDDESAMTRLQKMVSPFILRRLKEDVLKDLPEKLEEVRYVKFEDAQQKLYDAQVVHMKEKIAQQDEGEFNKSKLWILAELTKLRQICCSPSLCFENYRGESAKAESCMQLIQSAIDGGHRMLLFSQFTSMLALLQAALEKEGIPYYIITGETSKQKRQELVKQFNSDTTPVFLISLKAGGVGLNLTGADVVIHYDPWWNQAVQNQATDRAHRIGQTKKVTVYKLIARNTIEEKIQKLQEAKQDLAEQIISGDMGQLSGMSREDILELL